MTKRGPIKVQYQTLVLIWLALLTSQVMFIVLVWAVKPNLFAAGAANSLVELRDKFLGDMPLVTLAFALVAVVFLLLSFVLSRQHMRRAVQDHDAGCVKTGLVLGCALAEVPSLLGVIYALAFDYPYFYLWIAMSAFGILFHFPRKGNLAAASLDHPSV